MVRAQSVVIGSEGCGIMRNCLGMMDKVARLLADDRGCAQRPRVDLEAEGTPSEGGLGGRG